ncbi:MAG: transcriptional regulator [Verrucomicrobiae bacterium]|nr:transcriptional regulator [Verrucomicrobiae bacterium]
MKINTSHDLGSLIRDRRTKIFRSQQELASRVGVSRLWIMQLEKGKPTAQIGLILRTLRELGMALDASPLQTPAPHRSGAAAVNLDHIIKSALPAKP